MAGSCQTGTLSPKRHTGHPLLLVAPIIFLEMMGVPFIAKGFGVPKDEKQARFWLPNADAALHQLLAERGNAVAQLLLGDMYANGEGVPRDEAQTVTWYRKAAEQGIADAQNNLGGMYANGEGVPRDEAQAVTWSRKAAEQGHAGAQLTRSHVGLWQRRTRGRSSGCGLVHRGD